MAVVEQVLDVAEQLVPVGLRHAEHRTDRLHRQLARDGGQEVHGHAGLDPVDEQARAAREVVGEQRDHARREAFVDEAADPVVPRVVHHVDHQAAREGVGQDRAAVLGGVGVGVAQDFQRLGMRGNRPEADPVGGVRGGLVPVHGRFLPVHGEHVVRKPAGEHVEIRQIDPRKPQRRYGHSSPSRHAAARDRPVTPQK
ncbi:hypothetical protein ACU686_08835 [Yinghuangia aomiensis]